MKYLLLLLLALPAMAQQEPVPVPKDPVNTPIYGGIGQPFVYDSTAVTTTSFAPIVTVPNSGSNYVRPYRHIAVYNPSMTRTVYVCFAENASVGCSVNAMKIPPGIGLVLDHVYYGVMMQTPTIYMKLDSAGSVTPDLTVW